MDGTEVGGGVSSRNRATRVLLIEDDEEDFILVKSLISHPAEAWLELNWRRNLADGLRDIQAGACDIALADLSFPDSQGWDTFNAVRAAAVNLPFIVLTGLDDEGVGIRATQDGAQDYLVKGRLTRDQLVRSIRYAISRHKAEQEVRASESRLRTIIEQDTDAIVVVDERRKIVFANGSAAELFGKPVEDLVGTVFGPSVEAGRTTEVTVARPGNGLEKVAEMNAVGTRWNEEHAFLVSLRDVTDRVLAEQALKLHRERLEQLVRRRTADLAEANEKLNREISVCAETERNLREAVSRLEEQDRARSQFVANVSHELKTPLVSLHYAVGNLLGGVAGEMDGKARGYLEMMSHDCARMLRTVNDILDLARIEQKRLNLHMAVVSVDWCVARAIEPLRAQAMARGIAMDVVLESRSFVNCDSAKIERVLINVVHNAIKFNREGGSVRVTARRAAGQAGPAVEVAVSDSGIGIPAEHLPHIGERFYRAGDQVSGSGLGLFISKEVVEAHRGALTVVSPPPGRDSGAEVTLRLPLAEPPLILVADDDPVCRGLVEMQVGRAGYRVVACSGGEETIEELKKELPAALIIDLVMPGMDGLATITRIRSEPDWRLLPVLAITSLTLSPDKRTLLERFDVPAVSKPWEASGLMALLQETIWGHSYLRTADN